MFLGLSLEIVNDILEIKSYVFFIQVFHDVNFHVKGIDLPLTNKCEPPASRSGFSKQQLTSVINLKCRGSTTTMARQPLGKLKWLVSTANMINRIA